MSFLLEFLPIIIYILLIILLIIGIVLAIKCLVTLDKVDQVVTNINKKVRSLDGVFNVIDNTTDRIVFVADKVIEGITSLVVDLLKNNKKNKVAKKEKED